MEAVSSDTNQIFSVLAQNTLFQLPQNAEISPALSLPRAYHERLPWVER